MFDLRYVEISRRNPITRLLVGHGTPCEDVCIDITRAGAKSTNCGSQCPPNNPCQCGSTLQACQTVTTVCALEIDDDGYAVFEWPTSLLELKQGWYEGTVRTGCSTCGVVPIRIGPRCNVLEVETKILGPDCLGPVACETGCQDEICPTKTASGKEVKVYVPDEV